MENCALCAALCWKHSRLRAHSAARIYDLTFGLQCKLCAPQKPQEPQRQQRATSKQNNNSQPRAANLMMLPVVSQYSRYFHSSAALVGLPWQQKWPKLAGQLEHAEQSRGEPGQLVRRKSIRPKWWPPPLQVAWQSAKRLGKRAKLKGPAKLGPPKAGGGPINGVVCVLGAANSERWQGACEADQMSAPAAQVSTSHSMLAAKSYHNFLPNGPISSAWPAAQLRRSQLNEWALLCGAECIGRA